MNNTTQKKPDIQGFITAARNAGQSDQQIYSYLQQKGYIQTQKPPTPEPNKYIQGVKDAYKSSMNVAEQGVEQIQKGGNSLLGDAVAGVEGALKIGAGAAGAVASPIAPIVGATIGKVVDLSANMPNILAELSGKLGLMTPEQKNAYYKANYDFVNSKSVQQIERVAEDLQNAGIVAGSILGAKGVAEGAQTAVNKVSGLSDETMTQLNRHITTADTALKELPPEDLQSLGGEQGLVNSTKNNIVMGLRANGETEAASRVAKIKTEGMTLDAFKSEIDTVSKSLPKRVVNTVSDMFTSKDTKVETPIVDKAQTIVKDEMRNTAQKYTTASRKLHEMETENGTKPLDVISSYPKGKAVPQIENGRINPDEAIDYLDQQIGELSNLKNSAVFMSDETVPVKDFAQYTHDLIDAQKNWSAGKKQVAHNDLDTKIEHLGETYPKGIPLNELDMLKTEHTGLSKSYKNTTAKPFELDTHGIIGKGARDLVEKFTDDAPTKELNNWIQSHYDAIDLLESLRGKTPHGGRIAKYAGQIGGEVTGAIVGGALGHPFIGAMTGRIGADMLSSILHNKFISNPLKARIVENAEGIEPAVKKQMLDYIEKNEPDISELGVRGAETPLTQEEVNTIRGEKDKTQPPQTIPQEVSPSTDTTTKTSILQKKNYKSGSVNFGADIFGKTEKGVQEAAKGTDPLIEEAKKYKSLEEFVKAQQYKSNLIGYHGTSPESASSIERGGFYHMKDGNVYFATNKDVTEHYGSSIIQRDLSGLKLLDDFSQEAKTLRAKAGMESDAYGFMNKEFRKLLDEAGYDGIKTPTSNTNADILVFDNTKINKLHNDQISQLTDIWNKAHNKK